MYKRQQVLRGRHIHYQSIHPQDATPEKENPRRPRSHEHHHCTKQYAQRTDGAGARAEGLDGMHSQAAPQMATPDSLNLPPPATISTPVRIVCVCLPTMHRQSPLAAGKGSGAGGRGLKPVADLPDFAPWPPGGRRGGARGRRRRLPRLEEPAPTSGAAWPRSATACGGWRPGPQDRRLSCSSRRSSARSAARRPAGSRRPWGACRP
mmetsp:Transcript_44561/g.128919  ORF Transcript_44561/g.128919 Transcript_44561/m.128919 type:complete len:207 (+) Transcript_44561:20-640(+)